MRDRKAIRSTAAALAACAALALAACGGSDDSTDDVSDARAEYIASVDEICADTTAKIDAETQERLAGVAKPRAKDLEVIVAEVTVPALEDQYETIAALGPPEGDEEQIDTILATADETIAAVEEDPRSVLVLVGEPTPFDELNALLAEYGFTQCGPPAG